MLNTSAGGREGERRRAKSGKFVSRDQAGERREKGKGVRIDRNVPHQLSPPGEHNTRVMFITVEERLTGCRPLSLTAVQHITTSRNKRPEAFFEPFVTSSRQASPTTAIKHMLAARLPKESEGSYRSFGVYTMNPSVSAREGAVGDTSRAKESRPPRPSGDRAKHH